MRYFVFGAVWNHQKLYDQVRFCCSRHQFLGCFLGNKLYQVSLKRKKGGWPHIAFRDSFNWLAMKLEQMPATLGLSIDEGGKAFFPHGWNRTRNMFVRLPTLPAKHYYYPESMSKERLAAFNVWYEQNKNTPFCLADEIGCYCEQVRVWKNWDFKRIAKRMSEFWHMQWFVFVNCFLNWPQRPKNVMMCSQNR